LSAHPRPGYPLVGLRPRRARLCLARRAGCTVSSGFTQEQAGKTRSRGVAVTRTRWSVAKDRSFLVWTMGSTVVVASMRPRLSSRGELNEQCQLCITVFRLQCGHGSVAVENQK